MFIVTACFLAFRGNCVYNPAFYGKMRDGSERVPICMMDSNET